MKTDQLDNLEDTLRTLGKRANLSLSKKQSIRDKVFHSIGQIELADAIVSGEQKASIVSLQYLKKALMPQRLSFSMPTTIAVVTFVFITSVVTGAIAQNANPTDKLFGVKKVLERIELAFVQNPVSKAKISVNIATERLQQLEDSVVQKESLYKVLTESQIAFVNAKEALGKAQAARQETLARNQPLDQEDQPLDQEDQPLDQEDQPLDQEDQGLSELIERFSVLLDNQKKLLDNIEQSGIEETDKDIKDVLLAIRETIEEETDETVDVDSNSITDIINVPVVAVTDKELINQQPAPSFVVLNGTMGFHTDKPVVVVDGIRYYLLGSSVDLVPYRDMNNAIVSGYLENDTITLTKLLINSKVIWEAEVNSSSPASTIDNLPVSTDQ